MEIFILISYLPYFYYDRSRTSQPVEEEEHSTSRNVAPNLSTPKVTFNEPKGQETKSSTSNSWSSSKSSTATSESSALTSGYGSTQATSSFGTKKPPQPVETATPKSGANTATIPKAQITPPSSAPSTPDKSVPSWKKQATTAPKPVEEKAPSWKTPSWKQQKEAKADTPKPKLGNISESSPSAAKSKIAPKPKSSISDSSDDDSMSSLTKTIDSSPKYASTVKNGSGAPTSYGASSAGDIAANDTKLKILESEVVDLKSEVGKLQRSNSTLRKEKEILEMNKGRTTPTTPTSITFESAKASETAAELLKAKEQIREQERSVSRLETEKKGVNLRLKELETQLERRPLAAETNKTIVELQTKLKYYEKKSLDLETENNELTSNVQNLEQEMEEVQDNFREDEVDEYRHLKRDLEATGKNCRVLQFKLKKAEKSIIELTAEKSDLEHKVKTSAGGSSALDNISKIRQLEKDLDNKNQLNSRLEQQIKELQNSSGAPKVAMGKSGSKLGPVLSRTGSVERSVEDQLLKDLQDSIERENDLKEQLNMADESSTDMRKKMSRLEDETESLASQLKRMTTKNKAGTRRSPSPRVGSLDKVNISVVFVVYISYAENIRLDKNLIEHL